MQCPCGRDILDPADLPEPPAPTPRGGYRRPTPGGLTYGHLVYWRPEPICGPCAKTARDYFDAHGWPPDAAGTEFFLARGIVGPDETVRAHTDTSLAALAAERVAARHAAPGGS